MSEEEKPWRAELARQINEENERRLAEGGSGSGHRLQVASRGSLRAERVTQEEKLELEGTIICLPDLRMRPKFGGRGRKLRGTLEAHVNGFKYSSTSRPDECVVDVMYGNVKHAFFLPAQKKTTITFLHFHLHNHIMVGNKNRKDVQFYVQFKKRDRKKSWDRKKRINMDFQKFVNRVNERWGPLRFEKPWRDHGFHGEVVPYKARAFIMPTPSCLVDLVGHRFLVITLRDIELLSLERVANGQLNFDMVIVFRDIERGVFRINSIPAASYADVFGYWLGSTCLSYIQSEVSRNWGDILKTVRDHPEGIANVHGWWMLINGSPSAIEEAWRMWRGSQAYADREKVAEPRGVSPKLGCNI